MMTPFATIRSNGVDEPLLEKVVIAAKGWLFPVQTPPRFIPTTRHLAFAFDVYHHTVQEIVLMTGAYSACNVCHYTP